ncbi:3'(2'), 5'-bisphosphate nucleotidase [Sphingomonas vulcanisoli]|uniref:3'(2'), 5'-bisphosphate nucleotidase n=1 Tax=Sphingomonas vulcanisoli TaxID=1658060 RepID=A0ABX0TRD2_9SPHN|nr:3'(2'),5'-bisphosphate nucleotidase CysQ [Sphingomonas vulcanisoli]NIJ07100.1 3'(2'), 5'-bisphosphate nucleotidase [Sphingomonas vulcanisoli]
MTAPLTDAALATKIATTAGKLLLTLRDSGLFEGKALGQAGDRTANAFIIEALKAARPEDGILSEEEVNDIARCAVSRVWIVDPLDGTREYGEGRSDWAVHIALSIDGEPAIGAVALPALGATLSSDACAGPAVNAGRPRMVVSRSRPAKEALALAEKLGAEVLPMGSAGAKAMAVVRGEADIYLHTGGQYEWDNCAPAAVAKAAGLHVSRADGSPLTYNSENPYLPDLLICRPEAADRILAMIREMPGTE